MKLILLFFKRMNPFTLLLAVCLTIVVSTTVRMNLDFKSEFVASFPPIEAYHKEGFVPDDDLDWLESRKEGYFFTRDDLMRKDKVVWNALHARSVKANDPQTAKEALEQRELAYQTSTFVSNMLLLIQVIFGLGALISVILIILGIGSRKHLTE